MIKISVLGDVMSEPSLLLQAKKDGGFDYGPVFFPLKKILCGSDLVIANLETPVAGENLRYSESIYSFNAPAALVSALQSIGVDAVTTANNHAMDRGGEGFYATLATLDRLGMPHTGTYAEGGQRDRNLILQAGDTSFAVISYTYGVNGFRTPGGSDGVAEDQINLLLTPGNVMKRPSPPELIEAIHRLEAEMGRATTFEEKIALRKKMGIPVPYADDDLHKEWVAEKLPALRADVESGKKQADLVLFLPHMGGQFNTEPGRFSRYITDQAIKMGCDAVIASHAHTTQRAAWEAGVPVFYSLGNVSMSSNTIYSQKQTLPQYGAVAHLYVENKKIVKSAYSLFCIVEKGEEPMRIVPVWDHYQTLSDPEEKELFLREVDAITRRISGFSAPGEAVLQQEYDL